MISLLFFSAFSFFAVPWLLAPLFRSPEAQAAPESPSPEAAAPSYHDQICEELVLSHAMGKISAEELARETAWLLGKTPPPEGKESGGPKRQAPNQAQAQPTEGAPAGGEERK